MDNPVVSSGLLPLVASAVLTGLALRAGPAGQRLAGAAAMAAFVAAAVAILGLPPLPPRTGMHKLVYVLAAGVALGLILYRTGAPSRTVRAVGWPHSTSEPGR